MENIIEHTKEQIVNQKESLPEESFKKISNFIIFILVIIPLYLIWNNCIISIRPGEVGVVVDMLGNKKGIESKELDVGLDFTLPWKRIYKFPILLYLH